MITMIAHVAWTPDSPMNSFRLNDSFDGLEATPGFTVALADLFAWPSTGGQGLVAGSRRRRQACQRTGARHQGALGLPVNLLVGQGREWCLEQRRHMRQPGVTQEGLHALQGDCSLAQPCVHIAMAGDEPDCARMAADIRGGLEEIDLDNVPGVAIAFRWRGDPEHSRLKAAGEGIVRALKPHAARLKLLLLMIDGDVGKTLGRLLHRELGWPGKLVSVDGIELQDLDYVDLGELIAPPGVVPVVIKSLLFG